MERLIEVLEPHRGTPGIVYCLSKEECIEVTLYLRKSGFSAVHAYEQSAFLYDSDDVVITVATVAGGVKGIDKRAAEFVVHFKSRPVSCAWTSGGFSSRKKSKPKPKKSAAKGVSFDEKRNCAAALSAQSVQRLSQHPHAEPFMRRVLGEREVTLGALHSDTLVAVNNLAGVLAAQGKLDEAGLLMQRVALARKETLGAESGANVAHFQAEKGDDEDEKEARLARVHIGSAEDVKTNAGAYAVSILTLMLEGCDEDARSFASDAKQQLKSLRDEIAEAPNTTQLLAVIRLARYDWREDRFVYCLQLPSLGSHAMRAQALSEFDWIPQIEVLVKELYTLHIDRVVAAVRDVGVLQHEYFAEMCGESESESRLRCTTLGWRVSLPQQWPIIQRASVFPLKNPGSRFLFSNDDLEAEARRGMIAEQGFADNFSVTANDGWSSSSDDPWMSDDLMDDASPPPPRPAPRRSDQDDRVAAAEHARAELEEEEREAATAVKQRAAKKKAKKREKKARQKARKKAKKKEEQAAAEAVATKEYGEVCVAATCAVVSAEAAAAHALEDASAASSAADELALHVVAAAEEAAAVRVAAAAVQAAAAEEIDRREEAAQAEARARARLVEQEDERARQQLLAQRKAEAARVASEAAAEALRVEEEEEEEDAAAAGAAAEYGLQRQANWADSIAAAAEATAQQRRRHRGAVATQRNAEAIEDAAQRYVRAQAARREEAASELARVLVADAAAAVSLREALAAAAHAQADLAAAGAAVEAEAEMGRILAAEEARLVAEAEAEADADAEAAARALEEEEEDDEDDGVFDEAEFNRHLLGLMGTPTAPAPQFAALYRAVVDEAETECVVCMDETRSHAFVPCGHRCVCEECSGVLMATAQPRCPVCRAPAMATMHIRL